MCGVRRVLGETRAASPPLVTLLRPRTLDSTKRNAWAHLRPAVTSAFACESWLDREADPENLILVNRGPLLICSKQILFCFHLEAKVAASRV